MNRLASLLRLPAVTAALLLTGAPGAFAQSATPSTREAPGRGFTVEYYYKVRWGAFEEFVELYRKNHYPILLHDQREGRILSISAAYPVNHAGEADRWDMRVTIVWRDAATAHDDFDYERLVKQLYPDQAKFMAEERRRFELLLEHTDVPIRLQDMGKWK